MATKKKITGRRFGDEKPIQRNKDNSPNPEDKPNRSPGESNANRLGPDLLEDVDKAAPRDIQRLRKMVALGFEPDKMSSQEKFGRAQTKSAGLRAGARSLGRLGLVGYAAGVGAETGSKLVELKEKAKEGRERRRAQEEYEEELDKSGVSKRREDAVGLAKGGMSTKQQTKVGKVMKEFKAGSLHSGKGGKVVKSPKQAVAIAMSEARRMKKK